MTGSIARAPSSYKFPIFCAVAVSIAIAFAFWYYLDPSTIGWLAIIGPYGGAAAVFVFGLSFAVAEKMEKHFSLAAQIATCTFLPGLAPTAYLLPEKLEFYSKYGADPYRHGMFWTSFGLIIILWVCSTAGGLVGGFLFLRKRPTFVR